MTGLTKKEEKQAVKEFVKRLKTGAAVSSRDVVESVRNPAPRKSTIKADGPNRR